MRTQWLGAALIMAGCAASTQSRTEGARSMAEAKAATVRGIAQNAKSGAVIVVKGSPVYVYGLEAWPAALLGQAVTATGSLQTEKLIPSPVRSFDGSISQGAEGNQELLRDARYGLARDDWKTGIGSVVTVSGEARNVGKSAGIVTPLGPCYVAGMKAWPAGIAGKPVSVTGRLLRNKRPRTPENDDSAIGGQDGEQWALDDARWSQP